MRKTDDEMKVLRLKNPGNASDPAYNPAMHRKSSMSLYSQSFVDEVLPKRKNNMLFKENSEEGQKSPCKANFISRNFSNNEETQKREAHEEKSIILKEDGPRNSQARKQLGHFKKAESSRFLSRREMSGFDSSMGSPFVRKVDVGVLPSSGIASGTPSSIVLANMFRSAKSLPKISRNVLASTVFVN